MKYDHWGLSDDFQQDISYDLCYDNVRVWVWGSEALFFVFGAVWIYTTARRGNLLSWISEIVLEWERLFFTKRAFLFGLKRALSFTN